MSALSTYKTGLTEKLGNASTQFHTIQSRVDAINEAITNICEAYDIPQMFKKTTLTFTSGAATIPTDFYKMVKLWSGTTTSLIEFTYCPEDFFDELDPTSAEYYWTIDYDTVSGTRKIMIAPNTITSAYARYVKIPTVLVNDGDDSGLPSLFDDAVAYWAVTILLRSEGNLQKAQVYDTKVKQSLNSAYQAVQNQGGVKSNNRLRSIYEKYSILQPRTP